MECSTVSDAEKENGLIVLQKEEEADDLDTVQLFFWEALLSEKSSLQLKKRCKLKLPLRLVVSGRSAKRAVDTHCLSDTEC